MMTLVVNQVVIHWLESNLTVNTKTEEWKVFPQTNFIVSFYDVYVKSGKVKEVERLS